MKTKKTVKVNLAVDSYDIQIAAGLMSDVGSIVKNIPDAKKAVLISDSNVMPLYGSTVADSLRDAGIDTDSVEFFAGEEHKTLATYSSVMDKIFALACPIDRNTIIVALGGGVAGDLAGFIAATGLRGLRWVQCPTSLLADVDASVGGKTGIDHQAGKNLIGAFHQPAAVIIDTDALKTLPPEQFQSGLGECVKHAAIRDTDLMEFMEENVDGISALDAEIMADLIARNVQIKADIVSADEREHGHRAHLNFGHTIGHAIETLLGYGRITHGRAVAMGMCISCGISVSRGLMTDAHASRIRDLLERLGLDVKLPQMNLSDMWDIMLHDKKNRQGKVRFILSTAPGSVDIFDDVSKKELEKVIAIFLKSL